MHIYKIYIHLDFTFMHGYCMNTAEMNNTAEVNKEKHISALNVFVLLS